MAPRPLPLAVLALAAGALPQADKVLTVEGQTLEGQMTAIDAGGQVSLRLAGGGVQTVALEALQRIDLAARGAAPGAAPGSAVWLRSGQILPARIAGGDTAGLSIALPAARAPVALPWRCVHAVRFAAEPAEDAGFAAALAEPQDSVDLLFTRHDGAVRRLSVKFLGIAGDQLRVEFGGAPRTLALDRVFGLVLGRLHGAAPDPQPGARATLELAGSVRVAGRIESLDLERCLLRLDEGAVLEIPTTAIAAIAVQSDRLLPLTSLVPRVEQTPAFDRVSPPLVDRGPGGGTILLGGRPCARGFVLFPRTRLAFDLGARFDSLETEIGMEDRAGDQAHAVFRVLGDGKVLLDSGGVTKALPPRPIRVDVAGVRTLTLELDFGEGFDLGDIGVFAQPRLLRRGP